MVRAMQAAMRGLFLALLALLLHLISLTAAAAAPPHTLSLREWHSDSVQLASPSHPSPATHGSRRSRSSIMRVHGDLTDHGHHHHPLQQQEEGEQEQQSARRGPASEVRVGARVSYRPLTRTRKAGRGGGEGQGPLRHLTAPGLRLWPHRTTPGLHLHLRRDPHQPHGVAGLTGRRRGTGAPRAPLRLKGTRDREAAAAQGDKGGGQQQHSMSQQSASAPLALPWGDHSSVLPSRHDSSSSSSTFELGQPDPSFQRLTYHGGPIMSGLVPVYLIYYGDWAGDKGQSIIENFVRSIAAVPGTDEEGVSVKDWFNLHSLYGDSQGNTAATDLFLAGTRYVNTTTDLVGIRSVINVVYNLQKASSLPFDENAIFAVLSSSGINMATDDGAYCFTFCGWHSYYTVTATNQVIKFLYSGWSGDCEGCQRTFADLSANGRPEMEGVVDILAHELSEVVTDPTFTAYYCDTSKLENADACNDYFPGIPSLDPPYFNTLGINGYRYLLQANIDPTANQCVLGLDSALGSGPSPAPAPSPQPAKRACALIKSGMPCPCPLGREGEGGCVCRRGACMPMCSASKGRRCYTCGRGFCVCKRGLCKEWWQV